MRCEYWSESAEGLTAVGDRVLLRRAHLRRCASAAARCVLLHGDEDGVVSEASLASGLGQQTPFHGALDLRDCRGTLRIPVHVRLDQHRGADEARCTVRISDIADLVQQEAQVGRIITVTAGPAGGEDTGT